MERTDVYEQLRIHVVSHRHSPIVRVDLASDAGMTVRALHQFLAADGSTPDRFVQQVRFEGARADLQSCDPRTSTVATIARQWGFVSLARFSVTYIGLFNQSPAADLDTRQ